MVPKPGPVLEGVVVVQTILTERNIVQDEKWMQTTFVLSSSACVIFQLLLRSCDECDSRKYNPVLQKLQFLLHPQRRCNVSIVPVQSLTSSSRGRKLVHLELAARTLDGNVPPGGGVQTRTRSPRAGCRAERGRQETHPCSAAARFSELQGSRYYVRVFHAQRKGLLEICRHCHIAERVRGS